MINPSSSLILIQFCLQRFYALALCSAISNTQYRMSQRHTNWARLCLGTSRALPLHPGRSLTPTPCVKALPLQSVKGLRPLNTCPIKEKETFLKWECFFLLSSGIYLYFGFLFFFYKSKKPYKKILCRYSS